MGTGTAHTLTTSSLSQRVRYPRSFSLSIHANPSVQVDIDRETGTARMKFDLDSDEKVYETLYLIQLVLEVKSLVT